MEELRKQREIEKFIIVDVIVDGKLTGWSVADKQLKRVTQEIFETAFLAFEWAENEQ